MAVDIENMDADELAALPEAERLALIMGEESPAEQATDTGTEAATEAAESPHGEQPTAPATPTADSTGQPPAGQDTRTVPLGALHEERGKHRATASRLQQLEAVLNDPNALAQHMAQQGFQVSPANEAPGLAWEQPEAINALVQQAIAPMQQEVSLLRQERDQLKQAQEMDGLRKDFGPDVDSWLSVLDEHRPDMAHLSPRDKALHVQGLLWSDPEYRQQQIDAKAAAAAEAKVAQTLAGAKAQTPVTLAGLSPSAKDDDMPDLDALTPDQYAAMPESKREAMRMKAARGE